MSTDERVPHDDPLRELAAELAGLLFAVVDHIEFEALRHEAQRLITKTRDAGIEYLR